MKIHRTAPVETLRALLDGGQYPVQSRLPPERELAQALGLTRAALRKALAQLEAENRIWRHVGKGTFSGSRPRPDESWPAVTHTTNPAEIMEARQVLEPKIAAISALRATQNDLGRMEYCLNRGESSPDFSTFEQWDSALHSAIADSTGNLLLTSLFRAVNSLRQDHIWGHLKKAAMTPARQKIYSRQHRELVQAIQNRDPGNAERIMRIHLETVQKNLLGVGVR